MCVKYNYLGIYIKNDLNILIIFILSLLIKKIECGMMLHECKHTDLNLRNNGVPEFILNYRACTRQSSVYFE